MVVELLVTGCNAVNGSVHWCSEKDKDLEEELENPMGSVGLQIERDDCWNRLPYRSSQAQPRGDCLVVACVAWRFGWQQ